MMGKYCAAEGSREMFTCRDVFLTNEKPVKQENIFFHHTSDPVFFGPVFTLQALFFDSELYKDQV